METLMLFISPLPHIHKSVLTMSKPCVGVVYAIYYFWLIIVYTKASRYTGGGWLCLLLRELGQIVDAQRKNKNMSQYINKEAPGTYLKQIKTFHLIV